jgi:hypothetical protein
MHRTFLHFMMCKTPALVPFIFAMTLALCRPALGHLRGAQTIERLSRPPAPVLNEMPEMWVASFLCFLSYGLLTCC